MRLRTGLIISALVPLFTGCATLRATVDGWTGGRDGLTRSQRKLRDALSDADYPTALAWKDDDALLRALTNGSATYYAAQYTRSAALLDTAALLADERLTTSISKNALSLVTNDIARPYQPRRTERLFVPWYAMLSYSRLGQWEDAAVEARRLSALLAQYGTDRDDAERGLHASMHYLAGAVFERAGERGEAAVAYRNAHALAAAYPDAVPAVAADSGDVLIVVERGFVAHRVTETIHIPVNVDENDERHENNDGRRHGMAQVLAPAVFASSATGVTHFQQADVVAAPASSKPIKATAGVEHVHRNRDDDGDDDELRHYVTLAFPSLRRSARPWAGLPYLVRDSGVVLSASSDLGVSASVDDASEVDERRERAGMIAREMARATAKYAMTKAVQDKKGEVAGRLAEAGAMLMARADVRSWHVLPQELNLMRIRMPAGQQQVEVAVGDGANYRHVNVGPLLVTRGSVTVVAARFWREPAATEKFRCVSHGASCRY